MSQLNVDSMTLDEVNLELEKRDAARTRGDAFNRAECKALMARRAQLIREDNAAAHGLTVEQYDKAKADHAALPEGTPFVHTLTQHRRNAVRSLQSATATPAAVGTKAKK